MSYRQLEAHYRELAQLEHASEMLQWDEAVMMPRGGGPRRAEAMATLQALIHRGVTSVQTGEWLESAKTETGLTTWQLANVREIERDYQLATALPEALVRNRRRAATLCEQAWRVARDRNHWRDIVPALAEVVELTRELAERLAEARGLAPYDALLDQYQPGIARVDIDALFSELKSFLPPLAERVIATRPKPLPLPGPFPRARQEVLGRELMGYLGFDFERGRLDVSHHPFCGGDPDDTRVTTRYDEATFLPAMMAVLHETGHALYEQGKPHDWLDLPVGRANGAAVHESQSLLMEMQVCRSEEFLQFAAPIVARHLAADMDDRAYRADNLYLACTQVERSLIRVDADEVTYPLHVILRYELEQDLLSGALPVADLPDAWDAKMQTYLGIATGNDYKNGCMQDVHWYAGLFGYFPCYTVGAVMAAQLFAAARQRRGDVVAGIVRGEFAPLLSWLRDNVHGRGRLVDAATLLVDATGSTLGAAAFKAHLEARYLSHPT